MKLVITDTGNIWNADNPFLEKYKDNVLVVCLKGKQVTKKYKCFVSPYTPDPMWAEKYGVDNNMFKAIASVAGNLNCSLDNREDIVFLTDDSPSSLYPYYVLKDINEFGRLHLVTMSPPSYEGKRKRVAHRELLADLSQLSSFLYFDINERQQDIEHFNTVSELYEWAQKELGSLLPRVLAGIYHMQLYPCFFDFASLEYISVKNGFDKIDVSKRDKPYKGVDLSRAGGYCTLGIIVPPVYPDRNEYTKDAVEQLVSRIDGKKICNILREQRLRLAEANGIPFSSEECPSIGPCAGTCEKCDREAIFLRVEMLRIPKEKRVFPQFDPAEEVSI